MGKRRMFAREVIQQDALDALDPIYFKLYVFLILDADDDGIVGTPRMVAKMAGCTTEHLDTLVKLGYLLRFDNCIVAITHWHIHNAVRKSRYKPSIHTVVRKQLKVTEDDCYTVDGEGMPLDQWLNKGKPMDVQCTTQDKISKDKISKVKKSKEKLRDDKITDTPEAAGSSASSESSSSFSDYEESVLSLYTSCCPSLPPCTYISEDMRQSIETLEKNGWSADRIRQAFSLAEQTNYLKGGGKDGWKADLGWLCKETNLQKLLDGKYKAYKKQPDSQQTGFYGCTGVGAAEYEAIQKLLREDDPSFTIPGMES